MIKILYDEEVGYACLYDSVTMQAMGPIFYLASEEPQDFLGYAKARWNKFDVPAQINWFINEWRTFEAELVGKLEGWGFRGICKEWHEIYMEWEGHECSCKKADLHNATCAEDVLRCCTFLTCCGVEVEYSDYQDKRPCPECGEGWC